MRVLKIISQYKYLLITVFCIIYSLIINYCNSSISKYNINDTKIKGVIDSYMIDGNKLSMNIIGKEKILCTYYFKEDSTLEFKNTYKLGDIVLLDGIITIPRETRVFNLFNYKEYLKYEGINYIFEITSISKISNNKNIFYNIKNKIIDLIDKSINKDYLYTFVLGNSKYIDSNIMDSYRINGISHLFAVSGMHVTLLSLIILKIFDKFKYKDLLVIVVLIFYMFLTNFSPSILRAGLLFILIFINTKLKLRISTINIMLILLSILIIINPYIIYKIGFQYSYIISFYLILFNKIINRGKSKISKLFLVSFISFLVSLPITINSFFSINILSIILNIFFVPIVSSIIFPLSLISIIIPYTDIVLNIIIDIFEILSSIASNIDILVFTMAKMSALVTIMYFIIITYVLYQISNNKYKSIILLILILFVHNNISYFNNNNEITFIDVGQGDSIFISMPYNRGNILIDTGGNEMFYDKLNVKNNTYSIGKDTIVMYLKSIGKKELDYLILTHGDNDHLGEAIKVVDNIKVNNVIFNCGSINDNEFKIINVLRERRIDYDFYCNKKLKLYKYDLYFINDSKDYGNENDNSLVMYLDINNYKFLFTGDISDKVEEELLLKYNLDVDVLKVPHHGSKTSSSNKFLNETSPLYSIIEVGLDNRFNHPSQIVLERLEKVNSKIYRTDKMGSIKFIIKNNVTILTSRT